MIHATKYKKENSNDKSIIDVPLSERLYDNNNNNNSNNNNNNDHSLPILHEIVQGLSDGVLLFANDIKQKREKR